MGYEDNTRRLVLDESKKSLKSVSARMSFDSDEESKANAPSQK